MTTEFTDLTAVALVWLAAYVVHSTLLLGLAWLATRFIGQRSFALQDQIWKLALVLPVLTATIQQAAGPSPLAVGRWTIAGGEPTEETPSQSGPGVRATSPAEERSEAAIEPSRPIAVSPGIGASVAIPIRGGDESTPEPSPIEADWTIDIQPGPAGKESASIDEELLSILLETPEIGTASVRNETGHALTIGGEANPPEPIPTDPVTSGSAPDRVSTRRGSLFHFAGLLGLLHLAIAALRLFRLAWRERRQLASAAAINDGPARLTLDEILSSRRIRRRVQLLSARDIHGPAACGWREWRIVLPAGLDHELPPDELRALLAHELAHLVRRDTIWLWWCHTLCILLPVQPLNFLARRRWREAAEHLCDAWATESGVQPLTLAKCLARVADRCVGAAAPLGVTAIGRQSALSRRIERLTAGRITRPRNGRLTRMTACIIGLLVGALTVTAAPVLSLTKEDDSIAEQPADPVSNVVPIRPAMIEDRESAPTHAQDSREQLRSELHALLADLDRLNELLADVDDSPELAAAREQMQRRLVRIREREFGAVEESAPDARRVRGTDEAVSNE